MATGLAGTTPEQLDLIISTLQLASEKWVEFDWDGKLEQFETNLNQTKEAREQQKAARKNLSETTKHFKRDVKNVEQACQNLQISAESSDSAVVSMVTDVESLANKCRHTVKAYQEEIDNLTRRCKLSESNYSSICQALGEVPDPSAMMVTILEQLRSMDQTNKDLSQQMQRYQKEIGELKESNKTAMESSVSKQEREELVQLRREVAEYEVEFRSLKNQDITIRKLEAKIVELQKSGEEELQNKLEKAQQEMAETEGRRAAEALEREAAAERRVQTLELELKAERAGREAAQTHLLDADEGAGEREAAWEAQRRILVDDTERLRESLHQASRERDELRLRVAALEGDGSDDRKNSDAPRSGGITMADFMLERKAYEAEVSDLSNTANILREELRLKEETIAEERRELQAKIESLEREKATMSSSIISLEAQLASVPSQFLVDSMKRELRILKRLEYNADDIDADRDPEMTGGMEEEEMELESVLVAKLRRAESELVKERTVKIDQAKECEKLRKDVEAALKAKEEAEKLIVSLEKDLERAIATPVSTNNKLSDVHVPQENPATLQKILDPNAPAASLTEPSRSESETKSATEKAEDDHSVATIVMAQRDRLRARCEAVEAERDSFKRELQAQVQASESLKADNTKLYEKVRYLQNYNAAPSSSGSRVRGMFPADRDLDLEALEQRYEASVDPFRQFSRAERQRKLQGMSPMERTVFIVAKTVLGTKEMRTFLFVYVVAMHLLVFITTYHWSHSSPGCGHHVNAEHLAHLPPGFAQSVAEVQQENVGTNN